MEALCEHGDNKRLDVREVKGFFNTLVSFIA
jgi:hypothetical protein